MIKAVLFDVDGVLIDSRNANATFFEALLEKAGYPKPERSKVQQCFHLPMRDTIKRLIQSDEKEEIERVRKLGHDLSIYPKHLVKVPKGIEPVLQSLSKKYKLGIVTSRTSIGVDDVFLMVNIKPYFDVVVTFEDYRQPKPHPEPLVTAAKKLKVEPAEAIYVGDSETDVRAAKRAGMKVIYLSRNKHDGADITVSPFGQIAKAVTKLT